MADTSRRGLFGFLGALAATPLVKVLPSNDQKEMAFALSRVSALDEGDLIGLLPAHGGVGSGATVIADVKNGVVVTITSGGRGYTTPPSIVFTGGGERE
jgi:hypothetical protein